jgi:hypothetical protein
LSPRTTQCLTCSRGTVSVQCQPTAEPARAFSYPKRTAEGILLRITLVTDFDIYRGTTLAVVFLIKVPQGAIRVPAHSLQEPYSWSSQHPPRSPTRSAPLHHHRPHSTFTCPSTAARVISRRRKHQKVVSWHLDLHQTRARRLVPAGLYHNRYHSHSVTQPPHTLPAP